MTDLDDLLAVLPEVIAIQLKAIVENAKRLGVTWGLRLATVNVANTDTGAVEVIYDGDDVPIGVVSMIGPLVPETRVYVLAIPPAGNFVVGGDLSGAPARGVIAYGQRTTNKTSITSEVGFVRLDNVPLVKGRWYQIKGQASFTNVTTRTIHNIRYAQPGPATTSSTVLEEAIFQTAAVGGTGGTGRVVTHFVPTDTAKYSFLYTLSAGSSITAFGTNTEHGDLEVIDYGPDPGETGINA
jgi:hypothetical protein